MNIEDLTIKQVRELAAMFGQGQGAPAKIDNGMIGKYVIVRCRDAGVHAGFLESCNGREAVMNDSRRLWYWKAKESAFLSGVATYGLVEHVSKVGAPIRVHLTETCEIIECSEAAKTSIQGVKNHEP